MKYLAIDKPYQEYFATVMERLSDPAMSDIESMALIVTFKDRTYTTFFGHCDSLDLMTMAGIMQTEAANESVLDIIKEAVDEVLEERDEVSDSDSCEDGEQGDT